MSGGKGRGGKGGDSVLDTRVWAVCEHAAAFGARESEVRSKSKRRFRHRRRTEDDEEFVACVPNKRIFPGCSLTRRRGMIFPLLRRRQLIPHPSPSLAWRTR